MTDLTTLVLGVLVGIGLVIYAVSRLDKRSGCFYSLLMIADIVLAGTVLIARLS